MDQEEGGIASGPVSFLPHHQQQHQQFHHSHQQPVANDYEYSDTAGDEDEEDDDEEEEDENNGAGDDGEEEGGEEDENTTDQHSHQGDIQDEDDGGDNNEEDENDGEDDDDDDAVYPPVPVIAEISEDSQEYYMKPPEKMDDGPKPFRCDLCDKRFQEKSSVYRHIKEVHRKIIVLMGEDGRVAKVKSSPIHSCCDITFTTSRALLRHQKSSACRRNAPVQQQQQPPPPRTQQQQPDNKRKRVNGIALSNKRNGTKPPATSSEDEPFEEDSLDPADQDCETPAPPAAPSSMGIPYRCPYGVCPQFFTIKDMMISHLRTAHQMRLELVSIFPETTSSFDSGTMTRATGLTSTTIFMTDKRFPCSVFGCSAAFTRKDRLNQHIRTRHANTGSNSNNSNSTRNSSGFMSGLKVKLPSIQDHHPTKSNRSSSSHVNGPAVVSARPPKETIHPKKHACDYPGCEKSYTKNSHVKRHKLSAHPDLFLVTQSNGRSSDSHLTSSASLQRRPQVNVLNPDDEEEDGDEEQETGDAGDGSDDDNFEVFEDQDAEPVTNRRGSRNMVPRITPTLKSSFLSLTSNKSNGNRRKK